MPSNERPELIAGDIISFKNKLWRVESNNGFMLSANNLDPNDKHITFSWIGNIIGHEYTLVSRVGQEITALDEENNSRFPDLVLVANVQGIEFYSNPNNPTLLITYNENYTIEADEDAQRACKRIFEHYYSENLAENIENQQAEWDRIGTQIATRYYEPHYEDGDFMNKEVIQMAKKRVKPVGLEEREEAKHPEVELANSISIMDYARKKGYVIDFENDRVAEIQDVLTDNLISVNKKNNSWEVEDADGTTAHGNTIRFAKRMGEMHWTAAMDTLVEDRAKYLSAEEYNTAYEKEHQPEKIENVIKDKEPVPEHSESQPQPKIQEKQTQEENQVQAEQKAPEQPVPKLAESDMEKEEEEEIFHSLHSPKKTFSREQLAEIIAGTKKGLDIKVFDKLELAPVQMKELRLALEDGVDLSKFAFASVPAAYVKEVRLAVKDGLDIKPFRLKNKECVFTTDQAKEIRLGMKHGLTAEQLKIIAKKELGADVMKELRLGMQDGLEIMSSFNTGNYTAKDIHTIRMNLFVKQVMETLKEQLSKLYNTIHEALSNRLKVQHPDLTQEEIQQEVSMDMKDTVKEICEAIEDEVADKSIEEKKNILVKVFDKVVEIGNAIEEVTNEDKATAFEHAAEKYIDTVEEKSLQKNARESLKEGYVEEFFQYEENHNIQIAEFCQKVIADTSLGNDQKVELLQKTFGNLYGAKATQSLLEHLPEPQPKVPEVVQEMEIQTEYVEESELEP
ncbi:hypothetical protein [Anaeromicropila populeti]|nr:hypothetical protein [Anaeromicropila populeti]